MSHSLLLFNTNKKKHNKIFQVAWLESFLPEYSCAVGIVIIQHLVKHVWDQMLTILPTPDMEILLI